MKKSDPPHKLHVQLNLSTASGEIELNLSNFTCTCKAGKGMCNHKSALLFLTAHYKALGLKVSVNQEQINLFLVVLVKIPDPRLQVQFSNSNFCCLLQNPGIGQW